MNPNGKHSSSKGGRLATLCHEIAHLLLDRNRGLLGWQIKNGPGIDLLSDDEKKTANTWCRRPW